ncbi:MAG TPA: MMPL family transporter [Gaiellaceae bacterium]|nr:MMPL family transporter [Gaiellaceae bacterium]
MERLTRFVLRHRAAVAAVWTAAAALSTAPALALGERLTNRVTLPGTDAHRAEAILENRFGQKSTGSFLVVALARGRARELVPAVREAARRAARELPTGRLVAVAPLGGDVVLARIASQLPPPDAKGRTDDMRRALGRIPGATVLLTGQAAVEHDLDPIFGRDLAIGELVAIPVAFAVLVFTFGTLAFLLPLVLAAATIPTALALVWLAAGVMELSTYLQNLVSLIGLGIAIDYSLLVVHRFREELAAGRPRDEAVVRTMATAGRAVVVSGTAVAIGLALLLFMPLPFMRGFGIGGLIIPSVSVLAAVTLLPALLSLVGERLDRVRLLREGWLERRAGRERGFWAALAGTIMRRPAPVAAGATALLVLLALPVLALRLGPGSYETVPRGLESVRGYETLAAAVGAGAIAPTNVIVDTGAAGGAAAPAVRAAVSRLLALLERDPQVAAVRFGPSRQHIDPSGRFLNLEVVGRADYGRPESLAFVSRLRGELVPAAGFPPGARVYAGGGPPSGKDFLDRTYGRFPWLVAAVLLASLVLLARAFRSLVLPLKAIALNLLSVGAAYGLLVVVFAWGVGRWAGLETYGQVEGWIPVFLFAMLFGLSMDYEVFLVSRMREAWEAGASNEAAVVLGLTRTGRLVTAAGLIMVAAFLGFVAGSLLPLQQFGLGLAAAVLIDVTVVRALLLPSAMTLLGRWNWWLPEGVARVLRVEPSPLRERRAAFQGGLR